MAHQAKKFISRAIQHPGAFTAKAKAAGMSPAAFQAKVLAHKADYPATTVREANLRKTLVGMNHGGRAVHATSRERPRG